MFSFDQVKNQFAHIGGTKNVKNKLFQIFFLAMFFWSNRKAYASFQKKNIIFKFLVIKKNKTLLRVRATKFDDFNIPDRPPGARSRRSQKSEISVWFLYQIDLYEYMNTNARYSIYYFCRSMQPRQAFFLSRFRLFLRQYCTVQIE